MIMTVARGIQWGKAQVRGAEGVWAHRKKTLMKNDRYDYNQGEERNTM